MTSGLLQRHVRTPPRVLTRPLLFLIPYLYPIINLGCTPRKGDAPRESTGIGRTFGPRSEAAPRERSASIQLQGYRRAAPPAPPGARGRSCCTLEMGSHRLLRDAEDRGDCSRSCAPPSPVRFDSRDGAPGCSPKARPSPIRVCRCALNEFTNIDNYEIDYCLRPYYMSQIPLMRASSGDDPEGGAGCGVDRGS
jgi:hypothetical protein